MSVLTTTALSRTLLQLVLRHGAAAARAAVAGLDSSSGLRPAPCLTLHLKLLQLPGLMGETLLGALLEGVLM